MPTISPVKGDVASFQLVRNGINGGDRVEVKITGKLDYATARLIDNQLNVKHTALYPYFSSAVDGVDDPSVYDYITVVGRNGAIEVIGVPWIEPSTYQVLVSRRATLVITNWREDYRGPLTTFLNNLGAVYTFNVLDN